eukprot:1161334-Pelagomonas_calceolata.AAC.6
MQCAPAPHHVSSLAHMARTRLCGSVIVQAHACKHCVLFTPHLFPRLQHAFGTHDRGAWLCAGVLNLSGTWLSARVLNLMLTPVLDPHAGSVRRPLITSLIFGTQDGGAWLYAGTSAGDVMTINVMRTAVQLVHPATRHGVGSMVSSLRSIQALHVLKKLNQAGSSPRKYLSSKGGQWLYHQTEVLCVART